MSEEMASDKEDKTVFRQCISALDSLYSQTDIKDHIKALEQVEAKVFEGQIKDFQSFKLELSTIKDLCLDALDSSKNATGTIVEEHHKLPIFSSITYKSKSIMYSVHVKFPNPLNSWLTEVWDDTDYQATTLRRLFISKNGNKLVEARDNIDAILTIFFDSIVTPMDDNLKNASIKSNAIVVHPLGPLHKSDVPGFEDWMKVSIIKKAKVHNIIPVSLAKILFENNEGSVQKSAFEDTCDIGKARENEVIRQFAYTIIASGANAMDNFYDVEPYFDSAVDGNASKGGAPILHVYSHTKNFDVKESAEDIESVDGDDADIQSTYINPANVVQHYSDEAHDVHLEEHWKLLENYAADKKCSVVHTKDYEKAISKPVDAAGHFKRVYFTYGDVVQIFQRSTAAQRVTEIACLLKLRTKQHIGHIKQIIRDDKSVEMIGLTMPKYDMTLNDYLKQHTHPRLTSLQRMDLIVQMTKSIKAIHEEGIAHRDLSPINFMVSPSTSDKLADGCPKVHLYLIDFGKAVFFTPEDAKKWWVDNTNEQTADQTQVNPKTSDELTIWCRNLPYVMSRPDHGYRFYRSIQTLPKTRRDHAILPYLINAPAEDLYSLGTLIWKIFSGKEPWPGVFDVELKKLRETVCDNFHIDMLLDRIMPGPVSTKLLKKLLRAHPEERRSATDILSWIEIIGIHEALLAEWNSIIARTETTMSPTHGEARQGSKRGAAPEDEGQSPLSKGGRPRRAVRSVTTPKTPRAYKRKAVAKNESVPDADQDHPMTDALLGDQAAAADGSTEASTELEPKKLKVPKQYYIPTGRPVGRPRKKAKFKPTGRPKGSKNKIYYDVEEKEEGGQQGANQELQTAEVISSLAGASTTVVVEACTTAVADASTSNGPDDSTLHTFKVTSPINTADASTIAKFDAPAEMFTLAASNTGSTSENQPMKIVNDDGSPN